MTGSLLERRHFHKPLRDFFSDDVTDWFVGVDRMLDDMTKRWDHAFEQFSDYPISSVERTSDHHYRVTVKVPGYAKDEITVQRVDDELVVRGHHEEAGTEEAAKRTKEFEQHFYLAPDITVESAHLADDALTIEVSYPEAVTPQVQDIPIT